MGQVLEFIGFVPLQIFGEKKGCTGLCGQPISLYTLLSVYGAKPPLSRGHRPFSWTSQPRRSPSRGHGASTVAPRRGAWDLIDGELCATTVMHCAQLQRLHQSLCRRRTATLRWIATARGGLIQAIRRNGDVPKQPLSRTYGTGGGPGGIAFSDSAPGGFRFLSPCRKEQRDSNEQIGNAFISRANGGVSR